MGGVEGTEEGVGMEGEEGNGKNGRYGKGSREWDKLGMKLGVGKGEKE